MMKKIPFLIAAILFILSGSCMAVGDDLLVSDKLLEHVGLEMNWQLNLPIVQGEKVERMFIFGEYLYVITDQNHFFCIDRQKGSVRFSMPIAGKGLSVFNPIYYDSKLWFIIGNQLVVLDPETGTVKERRSFSAIGTSAAYKAMRNSERIYLLGSNKRLHVFDASTYGQEFMVTADNDSLINSIIVDERIVVFSTTAGNVVSMLSDEAKKQWQFNLSDGINAPLVRDGRFFYVGGKDTKLYKHNLFSGKSEWARPFHAGTPLREPVVAGNKVLYQYAGEKGLYGIDKASGKKLWQVETGRNVICEKGKLAYVLGLPGTLFVMDNEKGVELYSVNFANVSNNAINMTDPTLYVSDDGGRVVSIK